VGFTPCLVRTSGAAGDEVIRVGHPLLDARVELVTARARWNTVLATAFDVGSHQFAQGGATKGPSLDQHAPAGLAVTMPRVIIDEVIPLVGIDEVALSRPSLVGGATGELPGPLPKSGLDVAEGPVPVHRGGARRGIAVIDPLLVTKSR
jgi:hypothetical protein